MVRSIRTALSVALFAAAQLAPGLAKAQQQSAAPTPRTLLVYTVSYVLTQSELSAEAQAALAERLGRDSGLPASRSTSRTTVRRSRSLLGSCSRTKPIYDAG